ncbi:MAG: flavodoxin-dependent (E)-4-hydroxy-3-methylbut-2-enyl-diphosphate synthase, partial [Bacteroidales bacterium]|nr:flavodoxin-dependent (E)-4-hydroxy-3-methylbut-2-enyl-diphosphate synthase [Bacteroidales bacterium]
YSLALLCSPFFIDGLADGLMVTCPSLLRPAFQLLQACGRRVTQTTYIACPSCSRTGFDISRVLEEIKARTAGLPGITIAVMGCIVNGPGEMQGADYGYVGSGKGKVTLYKAGQIVNRNIPEEEAVDELLNLIRQENPNPGKEAGPSCH